MKKLLKPKKQLKQNTSYTALEVMDQHKANQFHYLVQNQPAALSSELDFDPYELEEYRNQHLAFELRHYLDTHASTLSFS